MTGPQTGKSSTQAQRAPRKLGTRHKARRRAIDLLFEAEARGTDVVELARERAALSYTEESVAPVNAYTLTLVGGVARELDELDDTISTYLQGWTLQRLPAVDRAILRLAVWELFHAADVPPVVAVDEAVELARQLSTDESPAFVNGVLGRVVGFAEHVRAAQAATLERTPEQVEAAATPDEADAADLAPARDEAVQAD